MHDCPLNVDSSGVSSAASWLLCSIGTDGGTLSYCKHGSEGESCEGWPPPPTFPPAPPSNRLGGRSPLVG